jgi:hypothetical protein
MTSKTRRTHVSPALAISCVALFLTLTGTAFAATLAKNSVRSAQIVDATVRTVDLRDNAVNALKIAPDAVGAEQIAENAVSSPEVATDSLTAGDFAAASVTSSEVADQSLSAEDLGPESVGANEIATDAVGSIEISPDAVHADELGAVTQRTSATTIQAGKTGSVTASCAADEQVLSGGGQPSVFGVEMTSTRPNGNGWLYQAKNTLASDQTITAFALCLG